MISLGLWFHEMNVFGQMVVSLWFVGVCICMYANKAFVRNKTNGNLSLSFCYLFSKSLSFHFQVSVCGCVWFAFECSSQPLRDKSLGSWHQKRHLIC